MLYYLVNAKDQLVSTMYVICIAIVGLSLTINQIIGIMFIVIIPFQAFINTKLYYIARCGAYINVFIEPNIDNLNWEKIVHIADQQFNDEYRLNIGKINFTKNLGKYGSSIFAFASVCIFTYNNIRYIDTGTGIGAVVMDMNQILLLVIYIMLCLFTFYLNRKGANFTKIYEKYIDIFNEIKRSSGL